MTLAYCSMQETLMHAARHVSRTGCDAYCTWILHFAVSLHVGARNLPSLERAAEVMVGAATSVARAHKMMALNNSFLAW